MKTIMFALASVSALASGAASAQDSISEAVSVASNNLIMHGHSAASTELGYHSNLGKDSNVARRMAAFGASSEPSINVLRPIKKKRVAGIPLAGGHAGITFRGAIGLRFATKF